MVGDFSVSGSAPSDDAIDGGREATFGFDVLGGLSRGAMPARCPIASAQSFWWLSTISSSATISAGTARCAGILSLGSCAELTVKRVRDAIWLRPPASSGLNSRQF